MHILYINKIDMDQTIHAKEKGYRSARVVNPFLFRSWLIFPAIKERFINKIVTLKGIDKPDVVIFDLEDSIANTPEAKSEARSNVKNYLIENSEYRKTLFTNYVVAVRINNHYSPYKQQDIEAVQKARPHIVILPKIETRKQVLHYQNLFPCSQLSVIIETLAGYEHCNEIVQTLRLQDTMAIGYEDLSAELGIDKPDTITQPTPLAHILNSCLIAAKRYNVVFVEGPSRKYGSEKNLKFLKKECNLSFRMGFHSKVAIHPTQVKVINTIFNKEKLRERAKDIVRQFNSLQDGTFVIGNEDKRLMMDTPSFTLSRKTLDLLQR